MGTGYLIGCNKCTTEEDLDNLLDNLWNENSVNRGNIFNISIGGGMLCFCKEQLEKIYGINKKNNRKYRLLAGGDPPEEIYKIIGSMTDNKNIDKIIYDKINKEYEFTDNLGNYPYYCENCKKLFDHFYFEMKKDNNIYTPEYICKKCFHVLEPVYPAWLESEEDNELGLEDEEDRKKVIKFKYKLFDENKIIKIKLNKEDKILLCEHCGNDQFSIMSKYYFD
jgi:hypothetical protein